MPHFYRFYSLVIAVRADLPVSCFFRPFFSVGDQLPSDSLPPVFFVYPENLNISVFQVFKWIRQDPRCNASIPDRKITVHGRERIGVAFYDNTAIIAMYID